MIEDRPTAEHVTRASVSDHVGPAGTIAVVTLDNHERRPVTLGPVGLAGLRQALLTQRARAERGEIQAVAVTGRPGHFCAGADLKAVAAMTGPDQARAMARAGHDALRALPEVGVPSFAFISGLALGGGLEVALHAQYRTVAEGTRALGLPEALLGLVPGWGGCWLLPRLVGVAEALRVILDHPLGGNRTTDAGTAQRVGLVDVVLPADGFLEASLAWAQDVLAGNEVVRRPLDDAETWAREVEAARTRVDRRLHGAAPAPYRALDLVAAARDRDRDAGFAAEDDALTDLMTTPELAAGIHALDLTTRHARAPLGVPEAPARAIREVGVVGAGLMAAQLAVLLAGRMHVPVRMREVDEERALAGRERVAGLVRRQVERGRLTDEAAASLLGTISVGTDLGALAGADLVIEAVTEVLEVKRAVFAKLEDVVRPDTVLATNTSALSVSAMADGLRHPERVVGLHFFNPVAQMALVEVVRAERTDEPTLATAFAVAGGTGKTAVLATDRPGFVVNRLLLRELSDVLHTVATGTPVEVANRALRPLGLPMDPFTLLQLVGLPVALHVLDSLHDDLGDRYHRSPGLAALAAAGRRVVGADGNLDRTIQDTFGSPGGPNALDEQGVRDVVLAGLAQEVGLMLDEGVVLAPGQIDLAMILGAGFGFHLGGLLPYLDRSGWSERVAGRRFLGR
ncbi:3-hydroxyacyl-CoA dehydrogenase NAD-binding domain-containing protein [Actinotalea sp. M2MS4P-6]|uniref:3-hydroxyacyl-CoA dehydrogenase NAD-binding domain-containing protein n=1 Tax=Actinotalea sp. M2MS4P-6 TaxID=2983762 RepID=UPI0021E484F0|nr:3-hydroxyacyl-CoA dehydrogenase NAD-binding domain-containing protein [Actinotalea sp. M2MS4P-6]MCV2396324.1 3-hydroxyacyl-CoA dehydrogenase NAD-binding domain-containing protein [Actinotalea sp. M2MS4P-6]